MVTSTRRDNMSMNEISAISGIESVLPVQNKKQAQRTPQFDKIDMKAELNSKDNVEYKMLNQHTDKMLSISADLSIAKKQLSNCDSFSDYRKNFKKESSGNRFEQMKQYMETKAELKVRITTLEKQLRESQMR